MYMFLPSSPEGAHLAIVFGLFLRGHGALGKSNFKQTTRGERHVEPGASAAARSEFAVYNPFFSQKSVPYEPNVTLFDLHH